MAVDLDDYDGPLTFPPRPCTCAGWGSHHESFCGQSGEDEEADPDEVSLRAWQDTITAPPEED